MKEEIVFMNLKGIQYKDGGFFNCSNIWDTWLISDTHFNHYPEKKIDNPWKWSRPDGWEELIINNWNNVIKKNDNVLHMGDFAFGNKETVYEIVQKLNGRIYLIKGNHDRHSVGWYDDCWIKLIKKPFIVDCPDRDLTFLFSHKKQCNLPGKTINIHGHSHEKLWFIANTGSGSMKKGIYIDGPTYINLSVEKINYMPIRLNSLMYRTEDVHYSLLMI